MRPIPHTWREVDGNLCEGKCCSSCKRWLPLKGFHKCKATHDKLQLSCAECQAQKQREIHQRDPEKRRAQNRESVKKYGPEYYRERHQLLKRQMVVAYGGKCWCCGEDEIEFLSLDHVDGGGRRHRLSVGGGSRVIRNLRDAGWPQDGYRLLCMNCQFGYMHGRTCPHQLKKES